MFVFTSKNGKKYIVIEENLAMAMEKLKKHVNLQDVISTYEWFDFEILR